MENLASPTTSILFTFSYLMTIRCLSCYTSLHASSYSVINNCDESYIIGLIAPAHPDEKIDYEVVFDRRFVRLSICAPSIPLFAYAVTNEPIDTKFCLTRLPWPVDMLRHLCEGYDATIHIYKYRYKIKERCLVACIIMVLDVVAHKQIFTGMAALQRSDRDLHGNINWNWKTFEGVL